MNEGLNKVILMGNLGADPELRYTGNGTPVLQLRMATNESFVDKNKEPKERTEWHNIVFWGQRAEALAKVLTKGDGVLIEGGLRTSSYEKDGIRRYRTEVIARDLRFTGRRALAQPPPGLEDDGEATQPGTGVPTTARLGKNGARGRPPEGPALDELPY
ncbi:MULTISPECIES: single-stranded DNA-binding protein [Sorangium]|uniref:Single-stranded DNA-binding protein n=1 Tax=Sorangium cellulosum (strain So ce56) TaxID=448385 RepID=A9G766_SORC5|nr:single-stranded DNA-binding protein [Sorangium cellulosum]CAN92784.1 ssDNA-binding protein [Sorangium cellulosum So ce56]